MRAEHCMHLGLIAALRLLLQHCYAQATKSQLPEPPDQAGACCRLRSRILAHGDSHSVSASILLCMNVDICLKIPLIMFHKYCIFDRVTSSDSNNEMYCKVLLINKLFPYQLQYQQQAIIALSYNHLTSPVVCNSSSAMWTEQKCMNFSGFSDVMKLFDVEVAFIFLNYLSAFLSIFGGRSFAYFPHAMAYSVFSLQALA